MGIKKKYYLLMISGVSLIPIIFIFVNFLIFYGYSILANIFQYFHLNISFTNEFLMFNLYAIFFSILIILIILASKSIQSIIQKIKRIETTIQKINFDDSLPANIEVKSNSNDEIDQLISSINNLIDRLRSKEISLQDQKNSNINYLKQLSHDINTPLTTIKLEFYQLYKRQIISEDTIQSINHKIEYISELTNKINIYNQKSIDNFYVFKKPVIINEVIKDTIKKWNHLFFKESIEIEMLVYDKSIIWLGETIWFKRLFDNMFSNMYLHSKTSKILIVLDRKVTIRDFGIGYDTSENNIGIGIKSMKDISKRLSLNLSIISNNNGTIYTLEQEDINTKNINIK
ncbi:HAMP domain-containing protein [Staphylococcus hominis]|uniref:HAMP domain-containing protein n=1 Tax=Staphylococcus hominis TaxID=1290 RepID=UPI001F5702A3|nr:HAMP domain-containing protein [Staphylococcus hominis]MCI2902508.1 HAMP domain-containing protein [Staphylococcus hominis]